MVQQPAAQQPESQPPFNLFRLTEETDENLDALQVYIEYFQTSGDLGYPQYDTLFESALKYKKFEFAELLLKLKEGQHYKEGILE